MEEDIREEYKNQSEFDMSFSYLNRLNSLLMICGQSSMNLDSFNWFSSLNVLFREMSVELKEDELKEWRKKKTEINDKVNKNQVFIQNTKKVVIPSDLYNDLEDMEIFLRLVIKRCGLYVKMKERIIPAAKVNE